MKPPKFQKGDLVSYTFNAIGLGEISYTVITIGRIYHIGTQYNPKIRQTCWRYGITNDLVDGSHPYYTPEHMIKEKLSSPSEIFKDLLTK